MLLCLLALTVVVFAFLVFFDATPATLLSTLSLHDALPISAARRPQRSRSAEWFPAARRPVPGAFDSGPPRLVRRAAPVRSEEHTSELQSLRHLVCRLLLEKKKIDKINTMRIHTHLPTTQQA